MFSKIYSKFLGKKHNVYFLDNKVEYFVTFLARHTFYPNFSFTF